MIPTVRERARELVENRLFQGVIFLLVLLNAATLGIETWPAVVTLVGHWLEVSNRIILLIFSAEIMLRLYAHGLRFFRDPWSVFDFIIVGISLLPSSGSLSVLRVLRFLGMLRLVSTAPRLRRVVGTLLRAVPSAIAVAVLLLIVFYVFAVITTRMFGQDFPAWFGTLGKSLYSLFQIMTLDGWSMDIVRPVMEVHPWAWGVFVPFIMCSSLTVLNLLIAILVDCMESIKAGSQQNRAGQITPAYREENHLAASELSKLHRELEEIKSLLKDRSG